MAQRTVSKRSQFAIGWLLLLAGCAAPTPYQPIGFRGGFSEAQLDNSVWRVSFNGNVLTNSERVEDFLMLRSAELTLEKGFTHFAFSELRPDDAPAASTPRESATPTFFRGPSMAKKVVMFRGKPPGSLAYDANVVCASLGESYGIHCNSPRE